MTDINNVYSLFIDYYGNLNMTQIKNNDGWSIYACKIKSGLNNNRYIFVILRSRLTRGINMYLNDMKWTSFQTRNTDENYNVPEYNLMLNEQKKKCLPDIITIIDRTKEKSNYVTTILPIKISLIHDMKKNNYLQYPDKVLLYQALETYNCVIEIL